MHATATVPPHSVPDKRAAILAAALRLVARSGLHNTPMAALAREAGVAAGTLYLYFPSKDALLNALYCDLLEDRQRATAADTAPPSSGRAADVRASLWRSWHGLARWHLEHPDASNVLRQCRASSILTDATREFERDLDASGFAQFEAAIARGALRAMPYPVFYALFAGPIATLAQMRDAGELEVTDAVLRATFAGVCRSVLRRPRPVA